MSSGEHTYPPEKYVRIDSTAKRVALIGGMIAAALAAFFVAKWGFANTAAIRADIKEVAELTTWLAPDDPQAHYSAAVLFEKSFEPADVARALQEYEAAVALAPANYLLWLELGRARERSGDAEGAERALRIAQQLAPHYSRVQWALGNALVRQGRTEEGFAEIRKAVASDPTLTNSAAITAWQILDGDLGQVRATLGESPRLNAALASILAGRNRFDEAVEIWQGIEPNARQSELKETGQQIFARLRDARRFRDAARLTADLSGSGGPVVGQVTNGGFEDEIRVGNAGIFDWQIGPGLQPQIAPTSGQKRSGAVSLVLIFNSTESKDFRPISQTVAVEPGREYEFEIFYRAELKTPALFKWQIVSAADGQVLAATDAVQNSTEWKTLRAKFRVTTNSDGVTLQLVRENCGAVVCQVAGNLWFDDASLKPVIR